MPELLHPGVYVQEVPPAVRPIEGVSTSTAAFIGVAERGPVPGIPSKAGGKAEPVMVTSFTDYTRVFGGFRQDSFLTYAVQSFFANGGRRLYVARVAPEDAKWASNTIDVISSPPGTVKICASSQGAWGGSDKGKPGISVEIADSSDNDNDNFKLLVRYGTPAVDRYGVETPPPVVETFDRLTYLNSPTTQAGTSNPAEYARTVINRRSEYIAITEDFGGRPMNTPVAFPSPPTARMPPVPQPVYLMGGSDGGSTLDFVGLPATDNTVTGTGLYALDKITDVNLIAIPGQGDPYTVSHGMEYCKNRPLQDCFFVADVGSLRPEDARRDDAAPSVNLLRDVQSYARGEDAFDGAYLDKSAGDYGAIYYPWIWAADPSASTFGAGGIPKILLPPAGFVAGIYARIDNARGVFKAPAGTEAGVFGALAPAVVVGDADQDQLNPVNVNVIRTVPNSGIVVWGTRTIGSDPGWRYIPVRRMAIFLRVSIYYGIQWAVFEPNDEPLWASLRLNVGSFMMTQFRAGAFQGASPDEAFFVKCDSTTTTQTDIDNGVVNILVGFAPLKPAEFVVLKLSQKVNQTVQ